MPLRNPILEKEEPDLYSSNQQAEDINQNLHETQEKLLQLRQQMEEYERRERALEELKSKRSEVVVGQKTMREKLARALVILERAEYDTRREVEQIQIVRQSFGEQLSVIEEINPTEWSAEELEDSLSEALTHIDNARAIYNQSRAKIDALSERDIEGLHANGDGQQGDAGNGLGGDSFTDLLRRGFAFTLPLIMAILLLAFVLMARR